jgi:uncharacterized membrane protein YgaE (UPF0421/DUF939 family)
VLSGLIPGHDNPLFAPVAALVGLGVAQGRRGRQAVEMILGVALGIAVSDVLVRLVGSGAWQLILVASVAMSVAILLFDGPLFVSQAGVWAILMMAVPHEGDVQLERFTDALVGCSVALVVSQLLFPLDPLRVVSGAAKPVFAELGRALSDAADALERRDAELAEEVAQRAAALDRRVDALEDAYGLGAAATRLTPRGRSARRRLEPYALVVEQVGLAAGNVRVLASAVARRLRGDAPPPAGLVEAIRDLADAVHELGVEVEEARSDRPSRRAAVQAAERAAAVADEEHDLATTVIVHQVESTAYDLLRGSGNAAEEARQALNV